MRNNKKGFTLVELLVVIAIIGLLATLAIVALNSARAKARDAKRVGDVKQVQTALELYFNDEGGYPDTTAMGTGDAVVLGPDDQDGTAGEYTDCETNTVACDHLCSNAVGFTDDCGTDSILMAIVPGDANPGSSTGSGTYTYESTDPATYTIIFTLEGAVGDMTGTCTATESGITCA